MIRSHLCPIAIALAASIAGCGDAERQIPESQIAVRVNGHVITVQQVQRAMGPNAVEMTPEQLNTVAADALGQLIDDELLAQGAVASALDQEPAVVQALDSQRRRVLSVAYVERLMTLAPRRDELNIREFYEQNPALFKRRRIYHIHELFAAIPPGQQALLREKIVASSEIAEITKWLTTRRFVFRETAATWAAEQVPAELLLPLAGMRDSEMALLETPKESEIVLVLQLIRATDAAISEAQAAAQIEEMLANRWRLDTRTAEIRRLRESATIEYSPDSGQHGSDRRDKSVRGLEVNAWPANALQRAIRISSNRSEHMFGEGTSYPQQRSWMAPSSTHRR